MANPDFAACTEAVRRRADAILENDHFVSINGWHSSGWIDKHATNPDTRQISGLCEMLAQAISPLVAEIVCGPAEGRLPLRVSE